MKRGAFPADSPVRSPAYALPSFCVHGEVTGVGAGLRALCIVNATRRMTVPQLLPSAPLYISILLHFHEVSHLNYNVWSNYNLRVALPRL